MMKTMNPDYEDSNRLRAFFNFSQNIQDVEPPANLVIEVRAADTSQVRPTSKYWSIFGLYDPAGALNIGRWKLPLYSCPT
jgi:hypothetical protein